MSVVTTTHDCELFVSGYTRKHYPNGSTGPVAIIALMSTFIDLWQRYRLTKDQLRQLQQVSDDSDIPIFIPFTTVLIHDISFQLCITVTLEAESSEVQLEFSVVYPDHIEFIGGYFYCCSRGCEPEFIDYRRPIRYGEHMYLDKLTTIPLSQCRTLSDLAFSVYFDVQQIKYAESAGICDVDNLSPLKGYGQCHVLIDEGDLTELINYITVGAVADNWTMHLSVDRQSKELEINPTQAFVPLDVQEFELMMKVRYTIQRKRSGTKYKLRAAAGRTHSKEIEHTLIYDQASIEIFWTGIMADEMLNASSIEMDIEWKIVGILRVQSDDDFYGEWQNISDIDAIEFGMSMEDPDEN